MLTIFVFVYLDDILIFSPDKETYIRHVRQVLERQVLANQLYVKAEKCEFHVDTVSFFLGFVVEEGKVAMDPEKVDAVKNWPTPTARRCRFLGFGNFCRIFIRGFNSVATPLHALTSVNSKFQWTTQAETALNRLRNLFTTAPILVIPSPEQQFVVEVDASEVGVGAILSQCSPQDGKLHPCAFLSGRLTPAERNYDVGNRELLASKVALKEWRHWLEGTEKPFLV